MKHQGFNLKSSWYKDGYKESKEKQIEMIKRKYPNYTENDWVLWVVADLYHSYVTKDIIGTIQIQKTDKSFIGIPIITRKPYPNKCIKQISMTNGRKRLYGIPLVFKSFEELCQVSDIIIKWDIFEEWYLKGNEKPLDIYLKCLNINYHLKFEKDDINPDYHFFTVFSKDNTHDMYLGDKENNDEKYYEEFDLALSTEGTILYDDDNNMEPMIENVFNLKKHQPKMSKSETDRAVNVLSPILPNKEKIKDLLKNVILKSEVQWDAYYYEKTETLKASYMADFLPESSFGF